MTLRALSISLYLAAPGNAMSAASGRVSFMFGLSGAALSVVRRCTLKAVDVPVETAWCQSLKLEHVVTISTCNGGGGW
jgi:hypothetical protein